MALATVAGVGMTSFGKHFDQSLVDLAGKAAVQALKNANISPKMVEAGFFANALGLRLFGDSTIGQNVFWEAGINEIPIVNVENACTSGSTAFFLAYNAVASGQVEVAMAVGAEKMWVPEFGLISSGESQLDTQLGMVAPASFALRSVRHMLEFGTTEDQLAKVAVKNRLHASKNPVAMFKEKISKEMVLTSPMIVDPLTRLQCCPIADGAAACVICSSDLAKRLEKPIDIKAAVLTSGGYENPQNLAKWETDYRSAKLAYEKSGLGPYDLDLVECHDAFTIAEILHYEALGLCDIGEGGQMIEKGETSLGGRVPVNVSGGLLSRGHPVAATGLAQVFEITSQLRGEAGQRQVTGAKIGLAHCMGGDKEADTKSCTIIILKGNYNAK